MCGQQARIEMVSDNVIITQLVGEVGEDQVVEDADAGYEIHDKGKTRYQCQNCGHIFGDSDDAFLAWWHSFK